MSETHLQPAVPVLWLVGMSGAGKTSLLRALTGDGVIGDGISPTTRAAQLYDFPTHSPILRILDTRGLGEAGHDPTEDLQSAQSRAQAILALVRLDDEAQSPVVAALRATRLPVLIGFTGADLVPDPGSQERARARLRAQIGRDLPFVTLALPAQGLVQGIEALLDALDSVLPHAAAALRRADEARAFLPLRPLVLRYTALAAAADVVPVAGLAAVPAAQGAMLRALADRHGVELTTARLGVLASALGLGTLLRMAGAHALRQGAKLVPGAGQTLGTAVAVGASAATTYALGRAGSAWLYGVARGAPADPASLRALYEDALRRGPDAGG